jgi:glycosyltransferase involved in cell wall biosynthesis
MTEPVAPMRIAMLASSRHAVRQPFAGGMESFVFELARALVAGGHHVTLFAAPGTDADLPCEVLPVHTFDMSETSRDDPLTPAWIVHETHAYLSVMLDLGETLRDDFDVVHNHSLHYLPLAMARSIPAPMLTTLHTPPLPWMEQAVALPRGVRSDFAAVSAYTARQWEPIAGAVAVVPNGVDLEAWQPGPGGEYAVWTGRLVPEKGVATAITAARRAGLPLRIAGPIGDGSYYEDVVAPLLGDDVEYCGHLRQDDLNALVGGAAVALVTPAWEEPYGLVTAEALASGTPVAALARGGIPEIVDETCGRLVAPGDDDALARALLAAAALPRSAARRRAEQHCSHAVMVKRYVARYERLICDTGARATA